MSFEIENKLNIVRQLGIVGTIAIAAVSFTAQADTLRVGISKDAFSLDPILTGDNPSIWTELLIFDQLVKPDDTGTKIEPGIAEKWEISPDQKTYTFHLNPNAKFSDGSPITAEDVVYSLKRAAGPKSQWASFYKPIKTFEVVDAHTVRLGLEKPFTPMMSNLALFAASIVPEKVLEKEGDKFFDKPVTSGPFVIKEWNRGEKMELVKNPNYVNASKVTIDGAELQIIGEDNSRVLKLMAGDLDAAIDIPFNQVDRLKNNPKLGVGVANVFRSDLIQLNTKKKPFDDIRVRQALNYAVDKEGLVKSILRGNGTVATSSIPVMKYHNTTIKPYPVDLDKAKKLLAEAGLPNGFSAKMLVVAGDVISRQVASAIQNDLARIGVKIEIQTIEGGSQFSTTKSGNYEMSLAFATSDTIDPDQMVGFTAVNPERANAMHTEWQDKQVNALYADERQTPEGDKRAAQFKEIEARVHDGAPFIFLFYRGASYAYNKKISGFKVLPTSNYRLEDVHFNK